MATPALKEKRSDWPRQGDWTYEDWLKLPDDGYKYEIIDGVLYMSPAPSIPHQRASLYLARKLADYVEKYDLGEVFDAPVDVLLPNQMVPFQPDIVFIHRERLDIIGEQRIEGAPDLIMEILSPRNWMYDRKEKMQVYRGAGVPEYWIVDPQLKTIEVFALREGEYWLLNKYEMGDTAASELVAGFTIPVAKTFPR